MTYETPASSTQTPVSPRPYHRSRNPPVVGGGSAEGPHSPPAPCLPRTSYPCAASPTGTPHSQNLIKSREETIFYNPTRRPGGTHGGCAHAQNAPVCGWAREGTGAGRGEVGTGHEGSVPAPVQLRLSCTSPTYTLTGQKVSAADPRLDRRATKPDHAAN